MRPTRKYLYPASIASCKRGAYTMKLTLAEPRFLKESIIIISDLVSEGRFRITKDAIQLIAMDPANVAMVLFKMLSSSFTEYKLEKEVDIGVNLNSLKQVLRRSGPSDLISLEFDTQNKLKVQLKGRATRTFSLPLIELEEKEQKVPELKFPVKIMAPSEVLNDAIADADIVGESVSFIAETGRVTVKAESELNQATIDISEDENTKVTLEDGSKFRSKYSIEYLKKMINGSKIADSVAINFSTDYPLRLDYVAIDRVSLSFILAPRVDND